MATENYEKAILEIKNTSRGKNCSGRRKTYNFIQAAPISINLLEKEACNVACI